MRWKRSFTVLLGLACLAATGAATTAQQGSAPGAARVRPAQSLVAFRSDEELRQFLRRRQQRLQRSVMYPPPPVAVMAAPPAPPAPSAPGAAQQSSSEISVTGSRVSSPGITNNQEAGVDEGGIVKLRGDTLVILRRGRLFTVSIAGGGMRPIDSIDAFPPGVNAQGDWYDEMLLSGDRVIVVGYSYGRGGTEINRFRLDAAGRLRFEDAYHLRSNDYYSSRNYASRLIGDKLIYYTPLYLGDGGDPLDFLPGIRRWQGGRSDRAFKRIAGGRQVFIPPTLRNDRDAQIDALHSVVTCDLTTPELDCSAVGVLGPSSRNFYVSGEAVYLWISDPWLNESRRRGPSAFIYRLPFQRERPSAIAARGNPVDQFSFREDAREGMLNVLVRAEAGGDAMWRPEVSEGEVALLRVPLAAFGDGSREAPLSFYRDLPTPRGESWSFRNRFVGDHVLYGAGAHGRGPQWGGGATVVAAPVRGGRAVELPLPHSVDRIEVLGSDALVVGGDQGGGLHFTAVELGRGVPRVADRHVQPAAAEGESRSHAFFYSPDPRSPDGASGILGLPVTRRVEPAYERFFGSSATMLFLRRDERRFSPAGELAARVEGTTDDACVASCVDWYGNARPIFLGRRTFALLGYELVEGSLAGGRIREVDRVNFAPGRRPPWRR
ncbi:MAG TPA: beta-propeller domain-containing protein [Allosphingosinicella sp.]|jgi:hypothetical protein